MPISPAARTGLADVHWAANPRRNWNVTGICCQSRFLNPTAIDDRSALLTRSRIIAAIQLKLKGSTRTRGSNVSGGSCGTRTRRTSGTCARTARTTRPRSIKVGKEWIKYRCVTLQPCIHDVGIGQVFGPHFNVDDIACSQGCLRKLPLKITHECG